MTTKIPDKAAFLLNAPVVIALSTVMPDGSPQTTPVWVSYDGELIWINTAVDRQKDRNMRANPKVAILGCDPQNPYHYLQVRGTVVERTLDGAEAHIDSLAKAYKGVDKYFGGYVDASLRDKMTRVIYKIKPEKVTTNF